MPLTAVALLAVSVVAQDKAVFRDDHLGLQFEHPKTWKVRKERNGSVFSIPLDGGTEATLQLFPAKFNDKADQWQLIQVDINRSLKRTVDKQWQEEYLTVPMLLTRSHYEVNGQTVSALVGLLYSG